MKRIHLLRIHLLGMLAAGMTSVLAQANGLNGNYSVKGVSPDGESYVGKLTVQAKGPVFRLTYKDGKTVRGMGIQRGNNLFAAWGPSDKCSVSALQVKPDDSMEGPWGDLASPRLGSESWRRQSGAPGSLNGTYVTDGVDLDGGAYKGIATVEARGELFKVTYKSGGETWKGVGVKHENYLAISYGGDKCGVTAYSIRPDNSMQGVYAEYGQAKSGKEEMVKGW